MDVLQTQISSIWPLALTGPSGYLVISAITATITAYCAFSNDYKWPEDKSNDIIRRTSDSLFYDFIIVGAGTAGSLLAGRLANSNPLWSVLLIEAGDDPGIFSEVPALFITNQNSKLDWKYETEVNNNSCLGFINKKCIWSKGKAIGGSSATNAMIYIRGHPKDYDTWKDLGNPGWSYEDLKPYFDILENDFDLSNYKYQENEFYDILDSASKELGLNVHNEQNNEALIGSKKSKLLIKNGKRLNTAKIYLNHTKNLHVMRNTIVQKLIIDTDNKIVLGVEILHESGVVMQITATKEVILSAGSVATPQILMLSGIGPKKHLNEKGIDCILDLQVGKNLQDHVILPLYLPTNLNMELSPNMVNLFFYEYILMRTGPFSHIGITDYMMFIDTKNISDYPDIQFFYSASFKKDNFLLKLYLETLGYSKEIIRVIQELNDNYFLFIIYPTLLHPNSMGEILLIDKNPKKKPIIKTGYFNKNEDLQTLKNAIKFVHKLENTNTFRTLKMKIAHLKISSCLQYTFDSDPYWDCYIRHMATTLYHPVGTAKMGKEKGDSVVNNELIVHGMKNLRIVDASVMPRITGSNTMAPTLVIAEKAADMIKKQYTLKNEL